MRTTPCLVLVLVTCSCPDDSQQPPLTPAERAVVKDFGGWTAFMHSYGLKPHDADDAAPAHQIVKQMAKNR